MSTLMIMLIAWAVLTGVLVVLLIYRSTLTLHEDTHLFLDQAVDNEVEIEQKDLQRRLGHLIPVIRALSAISGVMILAIAGKFFYSGIYGG